MRRGCSPRNRVPISPFAISQIGGIGIFIFRFFDYLCIDPKGLVAKSRLRVPGALSELKPNNLKHMMTYLYVTIAALVVIALISWIFYLLGKRNGSSVEDRVMADNLRRQIEEQKQQLAEREAKISEQNDQIRRLTAEGEVQRAHAEQAAKQLETFKIESRQQLEEQRKSLKESYEQQLKQIKENSEQMTNTLREMNKKQIEDQLALIKEQMRSTSEAVLKERQAELGEQNVEQVSKIVDPLRQSLKVMSEALQDSKEKHQEALTRLDATIQANMEKSKSLGESADRLTRALTGEVKVQGNFGELKLKQLLEDLGLKDGEQYSSQQHLRDKFGNKIKDDDEKGLIPDFVLHFPNNRDVIVDSKMVFTAYERYVNSQDAAVQSVALKEHIKSVRDQVDRLARKDYSRYLEAGYNKLNFVIMYVHTEGALNLALMNDAALWREAYDRGVLILGPQTMYMNLRILEMMWTQVRQLQNQEAMIKAANSIVDRTQDFAKRFKDVEDKLKATTKSFDSLKVTTGDSGMSIITAAQNLLKAGARENKKKTSLSTMFCDEDQSQMLPPTPPEVDDQSDVEE